MIKTAFTSAFEESSPRRVFLYKKMIRVKFQRNTIVTSNAINRDKTLICTRNMKNIFQMKITSGETQGNMTSMIDLYTWTRCGVHLVSSMVLVTNSELIYYTGDMVRRTGIHIPICVDPIWRCRRWSRFLGWPSVWGIKPLEAPDGYMLFLVAHLTEDAWLECVAATTTNASSLVSMAVVATAANTAATTTTVVVAMPSFHHQICWRLIAATTTTYLQALLMAHKLGV